MDNKTARQGLETVIRVEDLALGSMRKLRAIQDWLKAEADRATDAHDWLIQLRGEYLYTRGIWERPDHRGYTSDIAEAGRFTFHEARRAEYMAPEKYKAVQLPSNPAWSQGVPDFVWEALQRLIENGGSLGPASREDALIVAKYRADIMTSNPGFDLIRHLHRQKAFSEQTFGPGARIEGVLDHMKKELSEVSKNPGDVTEWMDIVLLAFDGAWRTGHSPEDIASALDAKQKKNESRSWPDWRQSSPDKAIEHLDGDAHPMMGKVVRYGPGTTALFRVESTNLETSRRTKSKSYRLYGSHVLGGAASAHESDVTPASRADLAIWAEKKGLEMDLSICGQKVGSECDD